MKDEFKRISFGPKGVGLGGYRCSCCGPAPGRKRKVFRRFIRRVLKQATAKEVADATEGQSDE